MSASMYNSQYVYKAPLPRIQYPPLFSGVRISFKHLFDSKLIILGALLFLVAFIISLICVISPFWFKLVLSEKEGTFGNEAVKRELSINCGIIFMDEDGMDNLMDLNKNNNQEVIPRVLVLAQVLQIAGICSLVACLAATMVLAFRRFASITGNFILAFFSTLTGVLLVLVFVLVFIMAMSSSCDPYDNGSDCNYEDNLKWRVFPIYSQMYRVEALVHPLIKLNWTFYISLIPAILALAGSVLLWIEAFKSYNQVSKIRYNQLRSARSQHEGDINPGDHNKYVYKPPVQAGPKTYGMQPVTHQGGPYGAPGVGYSPYPTAPQQGVGFSQPPSRPQQGVGFSGDVSFNSSVGFADNPSEKRQHMSSSPPAGRRRSPPPARRRSPSPDSEDDDSPPPSRFGRVGRGGGGSPPPSHRRRSPSPPSPGGRRRSPPPARRGGPPSLNSSVSEGPYISREIDL